jgi:hypothetical protein
MALSQRIICGSIVAVHAVGGILTFLLVTIEIGFGISNDVHTYLIGLIAAGTVFSAIAAFTRKNYKLASIISSTTILVVILGFCLYLYSPL